MPLTQLALTDFRSYADAVLSPGSGLVILSGENGAGKTNILEAVSLLAPGRGLRRAALSEMARCDGAGGFTIAARIDDVVLGVGTNADAPERRRVRINGAQASANTLAEWLSVLWLTPAMDRLLIESAGNRRRFLDRLVLALHPAHALHTARYEAAMRARNTLLDGDAAPDFAWLSVLEAQMGEHGSAIQHARADAIDALAQQLDAMPQGPFARAGIKIVGGDEPDLVTALRTSRPRDAAAGRALVGPHRADLQVVHLDKAQPAERCSTGEQKALLLGIILAHTDLVAERLGRRPVLLLDEVAAHLDPRRRGVLFERLAATGGQVWLTGTEAALFEGAPEATRFVVTDGVITTA